MTAHALPGHGKIETVWDVMRPLLRARHVTAGAFRIFFWLWNLTVSREHPLGTPDYLCVSIGYMVTELGRDARTIKNSLDRLERIGLIAVANKDPRRGIWTLFLFRPAPGNPQPSRSDLWGTR